MLPLQHTAHTQTGLIGYGAGPYAKTASELPSKQHISSFDPCDGLLCEIPSLRKHSSADREGRGVRGQHGPPCNWMQQNASGKQARQLPQGSISQSIRHTCTHCQQELGPSFRVQFSARQNMQALNKRWLAWSAGDRPAKATIEQHMYIYIYIYMSVPPQQPFSSVLAAHITTSTRSILLQQECFPLEKTP